MLKSPKQKGSNFERSVVELIRGYGFKDAFRTPLSGAIKNSGLQADITSRSLPFFVECKCQEKTKFLKWYEKAANESTGKIPVIVWSKNRTDIFAFLLFSDLMSILTNKQTHKINKPTKKKRLTLDETSNLMFSKKHQVRRKNKKGVKI